ncbi:MAG: hypothetical protein ACP5NV_04960 [Candidatus Woesearchaeota archaeon]
MYKKTDSQTKRQNTKENSILKNTQNIVLLLCVLVVVAACDSGSRIQNYHVGTKGVVFQPISSNPAIIYEEEEFALGLTLINLGAASIENATLLVNYDDYFLSLQDGSKDAKKLNINLPARSIENPTGGVDYFEYLFKSKTLEVSRSAVNNNINFNLCYAYNTDMTTEVCIDTLSRSAGQGAAVCKAKDYSGGSGQGAPIAIKKIEPEMLRVGENLKPIFRIYVENMGNGYSLSPIKELCNDPTKNAGELNKIHVKAWISADMELSCTPQDPRFVEKELVVRCEVKSEDLINFNKNLASRMTVLRVRLDYNYVDSYSSKLEIKRINPVDIKNQNVCGYYEVLDGNTCVSLCEYCVKNPSSDSCKKNIPTKDFAFSSDFGCACDKQKCLSLNKDGKCIFGYCSGSSYCCSVNECRDKADGTQCGDNYVCLSGKCSTTTECAHTLGPQNYTCTNINNCDNSTGSPITTGLCNGKEDNVCCKALA